MASIYRGRGLAEQPDDDNAENLKKRITFLKNRFRSLRRNRAGLKTGIFWGTDALRDLLTKLDSGNYDGLQICYGQNELNDLVLIARPVSFDVSISDESQAIQSRGAIYASVDSIFVGAGVPTEPPVAECPPLKICDTDE